MLLLLEDFSDFSVEAAYTLGENPIIVPGAFSYRMELINRYGDTFSTLNWRDGTPILPNIGYTFNALPSGKFHTWRPFYDRVSKRWSLAFLRYNLNPVSWPISFRNLPPSRRLVFGFCLPIFPVPPHQTIAPVFSDPVAPGGGDWGGHPLLSGSFRPSSDHSRFIVTFYSGDSPHFSFTVDLKSINSYNISPSVFGSSAVSFASQRAHADVNFGDYFEFYVDTFESHLGHGRIKCAVNGVNVIDVSDTVTTNTDLYAGNPSSPLSCLNRVDITFDSDIDNPSIFSVSNAYICNELGGQSTDFLGPIEISSYIADRDGLLAEWEKSDDDLRFDNLPLGLGDLDSVPYIQTDMHDSAHEFLFEPDDQPHPKEKNDPIVAMFRAIYKQTPTNVNPNQILFPSSRAAGLDANYSRTDSVVVSLHTYKALDVCYPVFPSLSIPWTQDLLDFSMFGVYLSDV